MYLLTMSVAKYSTQFLALNSEKLKKIWSCYSGIGLNRMSLICMCNKQKKIQKNTRSDIKIHNMGNIKSIESIENIESIEKIKSIESIGSTTILKVSQFQSLISH